MDEIKIIAYLYKRRFYYIGWVMRRIDIESPTLYYDNNPRVTLYSENKVKRVIFGFRKKRVEAKLGKYALRLKEKEEERLKGAAVE